MTQKAIGKNISLYPEDWETIARETEPLGMNTSQGVRYIIRQWQRLKQAQQKSSLPQQRAPSSTVA